MKNTILILILLAISYNGKAQLQNLDFEEWENPITEWGNRPTGWIRTNTVITLPDENFYYAPSTDSQNGDYAIKLSVWYNYTKDAALQTAPINIRPISIKGNYKYVDNVIYESSGNPIADIAQVSVYLTKWNPDTFANDTIGWGILDLNESQSYSEFVVTINYLSDEIPDTITVLLDPSLLVRYESTIGFQAPSLGVTSFFTVDNMSVEVASLETPDIIAQNEIAIYPNPFENEIHFENFEGSVILYDVYGKQIIKKQNIAFDKSLTLNDLPGGIYFLRLDDNEGTYSRKIIKR